MPGKRVQFDDETWAAIDALARERGISFQDLTDEAFSDLLKKPVSRSGSRPHSRRASPGGANPADASLSRTEADQLEAHVVTEIMGVVFALRLD